LPASTERIIKTPDDMESLNLNLSNYNVLVVDDVPLNNLLVEKMLRRFNFNVRKAENGLKAILEIKAQKPDLIILDLMMPVMDGFEVLEKVRADKEMDNVRIIVLSALNTNEDIVKAYNMGANDFITKPIVLDKLINSVARQLNIKV